MNLISTVGRVLLVLVFVVSGVSKLIDVGSTAQDIAAHVTIPALVAPYASQLEQMTGMGTPQMLAIAAGLLELVCALMVIFNLGARWFAALLVLFTLVTTFYFHDFWNQAGAERLNNMVHALKNLSLVGALLLIVGRERVESSTEPVYEHDIMRH